MSRPMANEAKRADGLGSPVVVVSGGAGGIGLATCGLMGRAGYRVAVLDRPGPALARGECVLHDEAEVACFPTDVSESQAVGAAIEDVVTRWGRLDALVTAAGIACLGSIEDVTDARWNGMLDVNLRGAFLGCRAAHPHLVASAPSAVVNVASKAGIVGLTMSLADQRARQGVRVNRVAPGLAKTPMSEAMYTSDQRQRLEPMIPLGRYARPDEIAHPIAFLASPRASYTTGAVLDVNGGVFMG